ncbi:MAG TPA: hypothetical protein VGI58_21870 [Streptosporangiaceae bacterium]
MSPRHRAPRKPLSTYGIGRKPARLTAGVAAATVAAAVGASVGLTAGPAAADGTARLDAVQVHNASNSTPSVTVASQPAQSWQAPAGSPLAGQGMADSPLAAQAGSSDSPLAATNGTAVQNSATQQDPGSTSPLQSSGSPGDASGSAGSQSASAVQAQSQNPHTHVGPFLIYDSVTPGMIPSHHQIATYATGGYAVPASAMSDPAHVLWIDTRGTDPGAAALDVEPGDATPAMAGTWAWQKLQTSPSSVAIIYTFRAEWPAAQAAISSLPAWMQSHVRWWIADPTGVPHIVPGSSATQWYWGSSYDISTAEPNFEQMPASSVASTPSPLNNGGGTHSTGKGLGGAAQSLGGNDHAPSNAVSRGN